MMYTEHWAYKKIVEIGWPIKVTENRVTIFFEDGDIYADFRLEQENDMYFIWLDGELINDDVDFYDTYDEAVASCCYYFITRF